MPPKDTPPNSPSEIVEEQNDEVDNEEFDENDIAEVYELDDDEFINGGEDDEFGEPIVEEEEEEFEPETDDSKFIFSKHTGRQLSKENCLFGIRFGS